MKRYRAAVVGGGFIGKVHVETLRRLPNVDVVALCDAQGGKAIAETLGLNAGYDDALEMLERERPDVLHICTPNHTHYPLTKLALERGIHVLCEKPFCTELTQAEELIALARDKGLGNAVNLHNRFYPMARQMRAMVAEEEIGRIFTVHGGYIQDWLLYDTDYSWRLLRSQVGPTRAVGDIGSHWLDLVEYVTGLRVTAVNAQFQTVHPTRQKPLSRTETFRAAQGETQRVAIDTEDAAALLLRFENGAIGSAVISQVFAGKKNELTLSVSGSKKSLQWNSETALNDLWIGCRDTANGLLTKDPGLLASSASVLSSYPGGHGEGFADAFKQGFIRFYAGLDTPDAAPDYATFQDGLRTMKLCQAVWESARSGAWIDIP